MRLTDHDAPAPLRGTASYSSSPAAAMLSSLHMAAHQPLNFTPLRNPAALLAEEGEDAVRGAGLTTEYVSVP